jgi:hypothetical protein
MNNKYSTAEELKELNFETKNPRDCFEHAILFDHLSADKYGSSLPYAGDYMYMYSEQGIDYFKNIATREYIYFSGV